MREYETAYQTVVQAVEFIPGCRQQAVWDFLLQQFPQEILRIEEKRKIGAADGILEMLKKLKS